MRRIIVAAAVGAALAVSGCAPLRDAQTEAALETLRVATGDDVGGLRARAEAGDARAQHAWAVVLQYGLHGVAADPAGADLWRARAMAQRGTMPISQYTPAFNGQPSRVNLIYVPRYDMNLHDIRIVSACAAALDSGSPGAACGDAGTAVELALAWAAASQ
ncbi:MAG TPA: hypothetical protein VGR32_08635 [Brevundimonas sp.]|jgi:hypothetical protein|uniref:hypothetical protein n=1 Tax=Brevundimonas sp. TaxID=1871086 RepID=UPI002DE5A085|nr:hypothetical protein [Brevundimonas sp.]